MAFGFGADELFAPIVAERALRLGANANNPALTRKEAATLIRGAGLHPVRAHRRRHAAGGRRREPRCDPRQGARRRAAVARGRRRALRAPEPARGRRAGQRGARAAARRPHLLQPQHAHQRHQRLRGELHVLLVRAPASRATPAPTRCRSRRRGAGCARASPPPSRSPRSTSSTACTPGCRSTTTPSCSRGLKRIQPEHPPQGVHRRRDLLLRQEVRDADRGGAGAAARGRPRLAARRRRRDLRAARAQEDLRRQVHRRRVARRPPHRPPAGAALELHDALRDTSRPSRSASTTCCACARCRTRPAASRPSSRSPSTPTTTR